MGGGGGAIVVAVVLADSLVGPQAVRRSNRKVERMKRIGRFFFAGAKMIFCGLLSAFCI